MNRVSDERLATIIEINSIGYQTTVSQIDLALDLRDCRAALKAAEERCDSLKFELEILEANRLKQNEYLIRERDEARAEAEAQRKAANHWMGEANNIHNAIVMDLMNERDTALAECSEQARLNGMGAEREAKLRAERDEARANGHLAAGVAGELSGKLTICGKERDAALQRAEKAEAALSKSQPIKLAEHASDCSCSFCKR